MSVDTLTKNKKIVLIIASQGYSHQQYTTVRKLLESDGIKVVVVSDRAGGATSQEGDTTLVECTLDNLQVGDYDGIFFIGGVGAIKLSPGHRSGSGERVCNCLDHDLSYTKICEAKKLKIPYGALDTSVRILAKCYALEGKKATGWDDDQILFGLLTGYGAQYQKDQDIVTDDLVVTARENAAEAFAEGIRRVLNRAALKK